VRDDPNLSRHARHHALAEVVGVGGIGCAAASYLASSGVGHLILCDFDTVDVTNLGRQTLYGPGDVGRDKAPLAAARLGVLNPDIRITAVNERLDDVTLGKTVATANVVLDGSDNFATRFQVNDACVAAGSPLISGAAIRLEGQLAVFGPDYSVSPCYRCLYSEADESLENCAGNGVLAPVPGVIGTLMAVEALKLLAGIKPKSGILTLYDAANCEFQSVAVTKRSDCEACGS
jgi:adenylyltransferase/sulfurtransferase